MYIIIVTLICLVSVYWGSDVDTVSLEFEAPPEALQATHLRMRPLKEQQHPRRRRRKGTSVTVLNFLCVLYNTL